MGKNWLIRTKSNHILGPVSKEKVVELYQNGSIKPDDEVCSGNGYWFYVRESDLIDRFLLGRETQSFNPISEAKDVLTSSNKVEAIEPTRDDITLVGNLNLNQLKETRPVQEAKSQPQSQPRPEQVVQTQTSMKIPAELAEKKKIKTESVVKQSAAPKKASPPLAKQNYLKFVGIFLFLLLFLIIYFRKTIANSFFDDDKVSFQEFSLSLISEAHGQDPSGPGKKKAF